MTQKEFRDIERRVHTGAYGQLQLWALLDEIAKLHEWTRVRSSMEEEDREERAGYSIKPVQKGLDGQEGIVEIQKSPNPTKE